MMKNRTGDALERRTNMKIIKILLLILILFFCSGCPIIIPLPSSASPSMYAINEKLRELKVGSSTKKEVISIIGKPDINLKRFILYKQKVQSGKSQALTGFILPPLGGSGSISGIPGKWMDVVFEFDEHGILTKYRLVKFGHRTPYPDVAECYSRCSLNYYDCIISTEEKNTPPSKCEETLQPCLGQCNSIEILHYKKDCDSETESCIY